MPRSVPLTEIARRWWPLAASWLFMGLELPTVSAVMARLADPEIHLAAYGGVVFPVALIVEAPIIMLLAASTALSKDLASYRRVYRFTMWAGGLLTVLHAALAFTPLYDVVIVGLLNPPAEVVEPARIGLMIMLPWTWTIAYRRFQQGLLIRFGHSGAVGIGTAVRFATVLAAMAVTVAVGTLFGGAPGIVVATVGIAVGVSSEAVYTFWRVRPVVRGPLRDAPAVDPPLRWRAFYDFYVPLALTSLLLLLVQPVGSAAIARMPQALASLAAWPVLGGLIFMFRSGGMAYNEVVVALLDEPGAARSLRRFALLLAAAVGGLALLTAATPLGAFWFETVSGLEPELADLARSALWLAVLWPPLDVLRNWLQGVIVHGRRTRAVTESVALFLVVASALLAFGVATRPASGLVVGVSAFVIGTAAQVAWLAWRARGLQRRAAARAVAEATPAD